MSYYINRFLEALHIRIFGFRAMVQIYGWSWRYWRMSEGVEDFDFFHVVDGIFCFQRCYYSDNKGKWYE